MGLETRFSGKFVNELVTMKSERFVDRFFGIVQSLEEYANNQDDLELLYNAIEEQVEIMPKGNALSSKSGGMLTNCDKEEFIEFLVEELTSTYMFADESLLMASLLVIGIHVENVQFTGEEKDAIAYFLQRFYAERGLIIPDVVIIINTTNENLGNEYFLGGFK